MHQKKAASVLPLPVGASSSECAPPAMRLQPAHCTGVGAAKLPSNQARAAGLNPASASGEGMADLGLGQGECRCARVPSLSGTRREAAQHDRMADAIARLAWTTS